MNRHSRLSSGMYSPRFIEERAKLDAMEISGLRAELDRVKELLVKETRTSIAGWDRHAEKDRAYQQALNERDEAQADLAELKDANIELNALAEQRAKEIEGLRIQKNNLYDDCCRGEDHHMEHHREEASLESQLKHAREALRGELDGLDSAGRTMGALLGLVVAVREKEELANVELALGMRLLDAETQLKQAREALNLDGLSDCGALCVECGPIATTDEDGHCSGCGATAIGEWLGKFLSNARATIRGEMK